MRRDVGGGGGDVLLRPRLGIEVPHHGYQRHIQPAKTWLRCASDVNLKEPASPSLGGRAEGPPPARERVVGNLCVSSTLAHARL